MRSANTHGGSFTSRSSGWVTSSVKTGHKTLRNSLAKRASGCWAHTAAGYSSRRRERHGPERSAWPWRREVGLGRLPTREEFEHAGKTTTRKWLARQAKIGTCCFILRRTRENRDCSSSSEFPFNASQSPAPIPWPTHGDREMKEDPPKMMMNQISAHSVFPV